MTRRRSTQAERDAGVCLQCGCAAKRQGEVICQKCFNVASAARAKKYYAQAKAAGRCPICGDHPTGGRVLCKQHNDKNADKKKARYEHRRAAGKCVLCAAPSPEKSRCADCRKNINAKHGKRIHKAARQIYGDVSIEFSGYDGGGHRYDFSLGGRAYTGGPYFRSDVMIRKAREHIDLVKGI